MCEVFNAEDAVLSLEEYTVVRIQISDSSSDDWTHSGSKDAISFKASSAITITGCGIYTTKKSDGNLKGTIKFFKGNNDSSTGPLKEGEVDVKRDPEYRDGKVHRYMFKEKMELEAATRYTIQLGLKGDKAWRGKNGKETVKNEDNDVTFKFLAAAKSGNSTKPTLG